jgi:hypothetical protein
VSSAANTQVAPELDCTTGSATVPLAHRATGSRGAQADVAQLVERNLAKVEVASSSLVVRSEKGRRSQRTGSLRGGVAERRGNGLQIRLHGFKSRLHLEHNTARAIGAAVARFLDTEEVTGSNPVSPTLDKQPLTCGNADAGAVFIRRRVHHVSTGAALTTERQRHHDHRPTPHPRAARLHARGTRTGLVRSEGPPGRMSGISRQGVTLGRTPPRWREAQPFAGAGGQPRPFGEDSLRVEGPSALSASGGRGGELR